MPVLIDGNNLLYAALEDDPERPPSRSVLCLRLSQWARRTGERVTVVFDGPVPPAGLREQTEHHPLNVIYSGTASADEVVTDIVNNDSAARRLIVVSSDREIAQAARHRKARAVRSDVFWAALRRELARPAPESQEPAEKATGLTGSQVQQWLRELDL